MKIGVGLGALSALFVATVAFAGPPATPAAIPADISAAAAPARSAQGQSGIGGLRYDSSKPIQVNADTFSADLNAQTGTYRGNVIVVQGDMKLRADEVHVVAPDGKARRMEAHGHVVVDSPSGSALGDDGIYDVVARVIHLTGNVRLTKGQNIMRGSALDVALATGQAHLVAVGQNGAPARVQGVFIPQQTVAPPKPAPAPAPAAPQTAPNH